MSSEWLSRLGIGKKKSIGGSSYTNMNPSWFFEEEPVELPNGHFGTVISMVNNNTQVKVRDDETSQILTFPTSKVKLLDSYQDIGSSYTSIYGTNPPKKYTAQTYIPMCEHYMSEFKLSDTQTIYLTARSQYNRNKDTYVEPTMACYLDRAWLDHSAFWFTGDAICDDDLYDSSTVPTMFVDWRDMGTINLRELSQVVVWCLRRISEGHKLSIGCHGAHGRTGTLLASLLVHEGSTAINAIARVRKEYCVKAIETKGQEQLVADYEKGLGEQNASNG